MTDILIVGATRGLGASLVSKYAGRGSTVFGTSRSSDTPGQHSSGKEPAKESVKYIPGIDVSEEGAGEKLAKYLRDAGSKVGVVIITAGYFGKESFEEISWEKEVRMYVNGRKGESEVAFFFFFNC